MSQIISLIVLGLMGLILLIMLIVTAALYSRLWRAYEILRHKYIILKRAHPEDEKGIWKDVDDHIPEGGSKMRWNDQEPDWTKKK